MPTLEWIGKGKVINHHQDVPFRVLERQYSFDKLGQHQEDNGSQNMIIHGDNLEALKALLPQYEGRVKCIYIDPPYNTGNEGWIYNDNVNDPKIKKWLGEVVGKEGEYLSRHDKWLCMMYPRLKLLHKLLAEDGAIFINGFTKHYPDFIIKTENGNIVLAETKGEHLANEDSKLKINLGRSWSAAAGDQFKYFMVFADAEKALDGAFGVNYPSPKGNGLVTAQSW